MEKIDDIALSGYAYHIKMNKIGTYLELRNFKLQYIMSHEKITVEDLFVVSSEKKGEEEWNRCMN